MPRAILIHGNGGATAADGWLPFVERDLLALGVDVTNETFPDNVRARASLWLPHHRQTRPRNAFRAAGKRRVASGP